MVCGWLRQRGGSSRPIHLPPAATSCGAAGASPLIRSIRRATPYPQPGYPQNPPAGYPQSPPPGAQGYPQYPAQGYPRLAIPPDPGLSASIRPGNAAWRLSGVSARLSARLSAPTGEPLRPSRLHRLRRPPAEPVKLVLTAASDEAKAALLWACLEAVENYRSEQARVRCGDALSKDPQLALAQVLWPRWRRLQPRPRSASAMRTSSWPSASAEIERLLAEALLAQLEERRPAALAALDALVGSLPGTSARITIAVCGAIAAVSSTVRRPTSSVRRSSTASMVRRGTRLVTCTSVAIDSTMRRRPSKKHRRAPKEANAYDSLASLQLRRGNLGPAVEHARKALELDGKVPRGECAPGDALLFQGNGGRPATYAALMASPDPAEHHDGAMRSARSHVFEAIGAPTSRLFQNAEKELQVEADLARKLDRRADQLHALVELGRMQIERGALTDAGHTIHSARELLDASGGTAAAANKPAEPDANKNADKAASHADRRRTAALSGRGGGAASAAPRQRR